MILGATTAHYNRLLAALLTKLHEQESLETADDVIIATLRGFENPTDAWPTVYQIRRRLRDHRCMARLISDEFEYFSRPASCVSRTITGRSSSRCRRVSPLSMRFHKEWRANWPVAPAEGVPLASAAGA